MNLVISLIAFIAGVVSVFAFSVIFIALFSVAFDIYKVWKEMKK